MKSSEKFMHLKVICYRPLIQELHLYSLLLCSVCIIAGCLNDMCHSVAANSH